MQTTEYNNLLLEWEHNYNPNNAYTLNSYSYTVWANISTLIFHPESNNYDFINSFVQNRAVREARVNLRDKTCDEELNDS